MKWRQSSKGYSLLEIIITIALIAILAGITTIHLSFFTTNTIIDSLQTLKSIVAFTHNKAMASATMQSITLNETSKIITFTSIHETTSRYPMPPSISFGYPPNALGPPSQPTKHIKKAITFRDNTIRCHPHGSISAGTIYVRSSDAKKHYALSCGVSPIPFIRIYQYVNNTWIAIDKKHQ